MLERSQKASTRARGDGCLPRETGAGSIAVVLLQLGGPTSLEDVEPFLEGMFLDPDLIRLPVSRRLRARLAAKLAAWRAKSSRPLYAAIGGKSPIGEITRRQAELLERELSSSVPCHVFVAMRYGNPSTTATVQKVLAAGCSRVILLPLYPQFSTATTQSSTKEWDLRSDEAGLTLPTERIECYFANPGYIGAVAERVREALARFEGLPAPHVVFSAHGLPRKYVREGDPYQQQIEETVRLVCEQIHSGLASTLCYQSRLGPQRWLGPSLSSTLKRLGRQGAQSALVVPISFVSDHLETLSEVDIEARKLALASGIRHFATTEALNDSPAFITSLARLVLDRV